MKDIGIDLGTANILIYIKKYIVNKKNSYCLSNRISIAWEMFPGLYLSKGLWGGI